MLSKMYLGSPTKSGVKAGLQVMELRSSRGVVREPKPLVSWQLLAMPKTCHVSTSCRRSETRSAPCKRWVNRPRLVCHYGASLRSDRAQIPLNVGFVTRYVSCIVHH